MQNRYTGDIGDFGKYALLRALAGHDLRLGVVWYLNPDEEANRDGGFVAYPKMRECDPVLHDALLGIVQNGNRRVAEIERQSILSTNTGFYSVPLTFRDLPPDAYRTRRERRQDWVRSALNATAEADIIFMDPDNGIAGKSASPTSNSGQKYVFMDELRGYVERGQSLIIYHHQTRERGGLLHQIEQKFSSLRSLGSGASPWALIFRRISVRVYFILPAVAHSAVLAERSQRLVRTLWGTRGHFELAGL